MAEYPDSPFSFIGPVPESLRRSGLHELIILSERTGKIISRGGAFLELFYPDGHTLEQRYNMVDIWEDYFNLFRDSITRFLKSGGNRLSRIKDHQFPAHFREAVETIPAKLSFDGELVGYVEAKDEEPTPYDICGLGSGAMYGRLRSSIGVHFHSYWYVQNVDTLLKYVLKWCDKLKPLHGLSGFCLMRDMSSPAYPMGDSRAFPFLRRYPGLDHMEGSQFSLIVGNRLCIRGVNWLTIINDQLIDMLGGRDKLMDGLSSDDRIAVYEYGGGVLIRAGEYPQVGDVNEGEIPEEYRRVSRVLKPIRFEDYATKGYFRVPKPLDEVEETLKWVRRFD